MHLTIRSFTLALLLLLSATSEAAILRVGAGCAYATPQLAFAAVNHGDTVRIRSGNYLGISNIAGPFIINHAIRVEGGYADCTTTLRDGRTDFHGNGVTGSSTSLLSVGPLPGMTHLVLDRITLRNNYKTSGDGAGLSAVNASIQLSAVEIHHNRALNGNGGGIFLDNAQIDLIEDSTVMISNNQAVAGGGIAATGSQALISFYLGAIGAAATLEDNLLVTGGTIGSAIYLANGADASLIDTSVRLTAGAGFHSAISAIAVDASAPGAVSGLIIRGGSLVDESASNSYSAIRATGANASVTIEDALLQGWSRAVSVGDGVLVARRTVFQNNAGAQWGGALLLHGSATATLTSCDFLSNTARYGGAIAAMDAASWSVLATPDHPARFIGNEAVSSDSNGGAIFHSSSGSGRINDQSSDIGLVEFRDNKVAVFASVPSEQRGGAIFIDAPAAPTLVFRSPLLFDGNWAKNYGGAIALVRGSVRMEANAGQKIEFIDNVANTDGGAISRQSDSSLLINQEAIPHGSVEFRSNHADRFGGAIAAVGAGVLRVQAPATFSNSLTPATADYGGQIYASAAAAELSTVVFQGWDGHGRGIVIDGGYAEYEGGGAYFSGVNATLDWVQFGSFEQPNRVFVSGGANVIASGSGTQVNLRNSSLRFGHSVTSGGNGHGLLLRLGATGLVQSVFGTAGTVPQAGEAWPCEAATLGHDRHCSEISDNGDTDTIGSGVYVESSSQLTLQGVSMERNLGSPGALYLESGATASASNVRISAHHDAVKLDANAAMIADHLTIAGNTGIAVELANATGTQLNLANSIIWANSVGVVRGALAVLSPTCNISQDAAYGIVSDPRFVIANRGSYRLGAGSSALDHCAGALVATDLDGSSRPQGAASDAGAFEGTSVMENLFGNGFE